MHGDNYIQVVQKFDLSEHTVVDWFNILREVCSTDLIEMDISIREPGISTMKATWEKKPKHHVGSALYMNEQWVWGAVERNNSSKLVSIFLSHHTNMEDSFRD